jgi:hypothetical protein
MAIVYKNSRGRGYHEITVGARIPSYDTTGHCYSVEAAAAWHTEEEIDWLIDELQNAKAAVKQAQESEG